MREDVLLREKFGQQWEDWATKTRYRVVPLIF
jgi:protein-S-isoprenylcysteine O-methyltransferase Ste14